MFDMLAMSLIADLHGGRVVTVQEVARFIGNVSFKSTQLDFIPSSLIKTCSNVFSNLICSSG